MPDPSVWSNVMTFIKASMRGIKKSGDYFHDVGQENVGIWKSGWKHNWPEVNIFDSRGQKELHKRTDVIQEGRIVQIEMGDRVSVNASAEQASTKMEEMKADVFKAMFRDHTQGGNAVDTDYIETFPIVFTDDNTLVGVVVLFLVRYRFIYNDLSRSN